MATRYVIGPSIGVARLGNSPDEFYLEPEEIGGRPIACDAEGNAQEDGGAPAYVTRFKDELGRVKRQAARFRIYRIDDAGNETEVVLQAPDVASISWTVHLANKKGAWYQFAELEGNLLLGEGNSYANKNVPLRNPGTQGKDDRRK
jgi:L-lysine 6-oxidase